MNGPPLLDTFTGRVRLEGTLTTRTALHIGAGGSGEPLATEAPVVRSAKGHPYIPGSSLKGVLRSAAEALFRGGENGGGAGRPELWACNQVAAGKRACIDHDRLKEIRAELEEKHAAAVRRWREEREAEVAGEEGAAAGTVVPEPVFDPRSIALVVWEESCTVCRLFGSPALAGRVRFPDLPITDLSSHSELRNGVGIDRDRELAADKVLYDFEAVPAGTPFRLTVLVDNPTDAEIGLLLYLLEELDHGHLALGGKSSRGLGLVEVSWDAIHETVLARDNPFADLLSSRDLLAAEPPAAPVAAAEEEIRPASGEPELWTQLIEIIRSLPGLPRVDKGLLGQEAAKVGITKAILAAQLGLGDDEKKSRRAWDAALDSLVECGVLVRKDGDFLLGGAETEEEAPAAAAGARHPALQRLYDHYIGAMARLWEETH